MAVKHRPPACTRAWPQRATALALRGANTISMTASGSVASPASSGL